MTKKKKTILVVEDDRGIREVVSSILEQENYCVVALKDGNIDKTIKAVNFDLILLDILLSGYDGRELCKTLKKQESTKKIPIVMFSAHPSGRKTSDEVGADDFLQKPFSRRDLLGIVKKFVKKEGVVR